MLVALISITALSCIGDVMFTGVTHVHHGRIEMYQHDEHITVMNPKQLV